MKKYHLIVFGCQMNWSDSERLATVLEKIGYQKIKEIKKADLVAIVSCSVRQMAVDRIYGLISNIKKTSQELTRPRREKLKIILTGCLTKNDREKLKNQVDLIFDIKDLNKLPEMILKFKTPINAKALASIEKLKLKLKTKNYMGLKAHYSTFPIAYVPIMTGCDNFCSYCVVPYTRGREISRPVSEIIAEIKNLIKMNYKIIILLGQNVNSYKSQIPNSKNINFAELLKIANDLSGNFWLTFISSHPKDLSDQLIETMAKSEKIMPYLHLPVQSGDNQILKKMNRHYTVTHYKNLIKKIRSKFAQIRKEICISTDIIVGFPGETKKQFNETAKLMRQIKFDMVYLAKYSVRPGTAAAKLKDDISQKEKTQRWHTLAKILQKTALENNKQYVDKTIETLITKENAAMENKKLATTKTRNISESQKSPEIWRLQEKYYLFGQTRNFKNIKITRESSRSVSWQKQAPQVGDFVKIKITKVIPWGLEGIIAK